MVFEGSGLLTATVFLPLAGALLIAIIRPSDQRVRILAGIVAVIELALSIAVQLQMVLQLSIWLGLLWDGR